MKAVAGGVDISSVLADLNSPLPYYKFHPTVQKALEICAELKALGNSLLSILEKKDVETLAMMLDCYDYTQDSAFATNYIVPFATQVIRFFDQHWPRGCSG